MNFHLQFHRAIRLFVVYTLGLIALFILTVYVGRPLVIYITLPNAGYEVLTWDRVRRLFLLAPLLALLLTIATVCRREP